MYTLIQTAAWLNERKRDELLLWNWKTTAARLAA
jgi:hypothetical protein